MRYAAVVALASALGLALWTAMPGGGSVSARSGRSPSSAASTRNCPPGNLGTVALQRGGVLELLNLHGCRVRTLVRSGVSNPVQISPDGRWIAFGGGYVSARGGTVHRTPGAHTWRPSGTWAPHRDVLALVTTHGGLLLERPGRTSRRLLPDGWGAQTVAFSPDGRTLAVSRSLGHREQIWLLKSRTAARRMLFREPTHEGAPPLLQGFSPNGHWVLFWKDLFGSASMLADGLPLYALPVAGGTPHLITRGELHYRDFLTWCGNRLAYVVDHGGRLVTQGDGIAVASPPSWRSHTLLAAGGATSWNAVACAPGDGPLAISAGPSSSSNMNIPAGSEHRSLWLVSPTGGTPSRLAVADPQQGASDELPMWSADGRWLLFVRGVTHGSYVQHGALYAIDPYGGNPIGPIAPIGSAGGYYGDYGWENVLDWHR